MQLPVLCPVPVSTRTLTSQGIGFLETLKKKPANLFKNNLNNPKNNLKSQIKKKKNGGIVELLIPTFFKKKKAHEGTKTFLGKKNMGRLF